MSFQIKSRKRLTFRDKKTDHVPIDQRRRRKFITNKFERDLGFDETILCYCDVYMTMSFLSNLQAIFKESDFFFPFKNYFLKKKIIIKPDLVLGY